MMQPGSDSDDIAFGSEDTPKARFRHPIAVVFQLLFRVGALVAYLLCGWFTGSFIIGFVVILLLLAMDFWTVKNITGRLLVSLRWWNYVDDEGKSHWVFESRKGNRARKYVNAAESRIFWASLVLAPLLWVVLFFAAIFTLKFTWMMVTILGLSLNGANLYGYVRCRVGSAGNLRSTATSYFGKQMLSAWWKSRTAPQAAETETV